MVDTLEVDGFYAEYEGDGRRNSPYDSRMLLKVLVYAHASGVFSSRKIARKLEEDVAFRVLGAGNFPDHRTVNRLRQEHWEEFAGIFGQVVKLAREMKLMRMGTLAIDGSKVRANASKRKGMSYGRMLAEKKITAYVALGREGQRGKDILPSTKHTHTQAMQERMRSAEGQHWYGPRKWLAEPPFGWIKHVLGFRRFSLRGHQKVKAEWQLVCAALNLKRMAVLSTS